MRRLPKSTQPHVPIATIEPITKHLKPPHRRSRIGIDTFASSPPDKEGHVCADVIVNHFTNFVAIYPAKDHEASTLASALFQHFITYGTYDEVASDWGSDITAAVTQELFRLFGAKYRLAMVGVHTSSGVEGTNSLILGHLRAICRDKYFRDRWGSPQVIGLVEYIINNSVCSETGIRRFDNMFGSDAGTYFKLPDNLAEGDRSHTYIKLLNEDLHRLQEISRLVHADVIAKRRSAVTPATQNVFLPGELVLLQRDPDKIYPTKLSLFHRAV